LKIGYHLDFQICKRFCKFAPVILLEQKALESSQRVTFSFSVDQLNSKLWQFTVGCWKNSFCAMDGAEIAAKNSLYLRYDCEKRHCFSFPWNLFFEGVVKFKVMTMLHIQRIYYHNTS